MLSQKIKSIKHIGSKRLVDIEIDSNDHIFYANGIATSNSHAIAYGDIALWCAVAKSHFPEEFFCAYMYNAGDKDDVAILVNDAKQFNIPVLTPSILKLSTNFEPDGLSIRCGMANISKIGEKNVAKLMETIQETEQLLQKPIKDWSWYEILLYVTPETSKTVIQNLISVGALGHLGQYRRYLLYEYVKFLELDAKDIAFMRRREKATFTEGLEDLVNSMTEVRSKTGVLSYVIDSVKHTAKHVTKLRDILKVLKTPSSGLEDSEEWISNSEEQLLGIPITCMKLDTCDRTFGNCLCVDVRRTDLKSINIAAQITKVSQYVPKQGKLEGQTMAYLVLADTSGSCEAVAFPNKYKDFEFLLFEGNTVGISGRRSSSGGLQVDKVIQL